MRPGGFAEPHPKNSPQDFFCPPGRRRQAQPVRIHPCNIPHNFIQKQKSSAQTALLLVRPGGFAEPRPKNSPQDCFCPPEQTAGTGCSNPPLQHPTQFHTKTKEQHPKSCCSWCDREDSNLWPSGSENCDVRENSMIKRRKLCSVHNFRRCLWWL